MGSVGSGASSAWTLMYLRCSHRIVCVGGDGMFSEVLHGLIGRTQRSAGVDPNQPRAALVPSPLRIGIIPAGRAWHPCPPCPCSLSLTLSVTHAVSHSRLLDEHR